MKGVKEVGGCRRYWSVRHSSTGMYKGAREGRGLHVKFSEIDFLVKLIEETDIYQMLMVP